MTSAPVGIDCGTACSDDFAAGQLITLTAIPEATSTFMGWSGGGCTGRCVSRAPYLKAVKYWSGRRPLRATRLFDDAGQLRSGTYVERLEREGWQMIDDQVGATRLRKPIRAHVMLEKTVHRADVSVSYPRRHDRHRLIARGGRILDVDWDWADLHGDRLLWTARGVLHASASLTEDGTVRNARALYDFTGLRFQRVQAPY